MKHVRASWSDAVLVCAKCSKKLDGGFGAKGKQSLAKALRKHLGLKKGRKGAAGIVEVPCLKLCPRGAVTVVDGNRPGDWLVVPAGADLDALVAELAIGSAGVARGGGADQCDHVGDALGPVRTELVGEIEGGEAVFDMGGEDIRG